MYYTGESYKCKKNLIFITNSDKKALNIFDGIDFGLYTGNYENIRQVFYASTGRDFCDAVAGADRTGMDDANFVHDEIFIKLRHRNNQFLGVDRFNGAVYCVYYHTICYIYRRDVCV